MPPRPRAVYHATTGTYTKAPGEDDVGIALGITGYKGRVHVNFAPPITERFEDTKLLALEMDRQILGGYRLFPVHYLAYAQWVTPTRNCRCPRRRMCSRPMNWPRPRRNGSGA